jgi:uncharacterized protein with ParB-like and HNH nuclease domain
MEGKEAKMNFQEKTIDSIFSNLNDMFFAIPNYQRAFSWENKEENRQLEQFFNDLYEQSKNKNNYFFGNILVEEDKVDSCIKIIDGQQRITTIIIFIRSLVNILSERSKTEVININLSEIENTYIHFNGKAKLVPCKIDQVYFDKVIINNTSSTVSSQSQARIKKAKYYFDKRLKAIKITDEIVKMFNKLQLSIVTVTTINDKTDSAFIFELQNNRGRDITEMEQVKAFLMYQIYINDDSSSVDKIIDTISKFYEIIYLCLNDINLNEDNLLWWHCYAYYGYEYTNNFNYVREILKEKIDEIKEKNGRITFISNFVSELKKTFLDMHDMKENKTSFYLKRLNFLGIPDNLYAIIINGYRFLNKNDKLNYLDTLFHICELLSFRLAIIPTNGNVNMYKRLDSILDFQGNLKLLYSNIKIKFSEEDWRWTDDSMHEVLMGPVYEKVTNNVIYYILKIYEQEISKKECPKLRRISIEHISPQTPPKVTNSGYELTKKSEYSVKFKNKYLHCIGNLLLSNEKQQHELYNYKFSEKYKIYKNNILGLEQQKEINKFFLSPKKIKWGIPEIENRRNRIIKFIEENWNFKNNDKYFS